jgi:dipeptidyl aminopeptidase/acylaminoacyl peptidase
MFFIIDIWPLLASIKNKKRPMKSTVMLIFIFLTFTFQSLSQTKNGEILKTEKYRITTPYDSLSNFLQWYFPKKMYDEAKNQKTHECLKIKYSSDIHQVEGFIYKPVETQSKKYPVIIWNRGGTGNYGKFEESDLVTFHQIAKRGYIIVASNLRYINNKEMYDQSGGDDLNDILNLTPLIKELDYADTSNIFMVGYSRGALMTHLAIKNNAPINAAAVIAGVTDAKVFYTSRPEFIEGWYYNGYVFNGLKNNLPDFENRKEEYLLERSPIHWVEKINTPILILHSRTDSKVPVEHSINLASEAQRLGKIYSLIIYDDDGHSLPGNRDDVFDRICNWFQKYKQ